MDALCLAYYQNEALYYLKGVSAEKDGVRWVGKDLTVLSTLIQKHSWMLDDYFSFVFICTSPEGRYAEVKIDDAGNAELKTLSQGDISKILTQQYPKITPGYQGRHMERYRIS
ncbi:Uncharacterized protein AC499_1402 [Pseudomonas amygdali pv. lachrymans]|uniref:Uncharacterized protein n=1 Tax=Pseudomonas amygdali pv. lachrymans TaxID=53707 RepID=A0ABR5KQZ7_PSEAV|nr:Uncharacterized protein AC499_0443 [Pseudomonas amygdali pv. lachrymans]KPC18200.1 Uncharacterized protein AC499_1402 [Pseudomonas amygdali pv. lachrymans]